MSTAVGRHSHGYFVTSTTPALAKPRSGFLHRLKAWRGSAQAGAASPVAEGLPAEEAQEQQRGEPGPVEPNERLADTSDSIAAIQDTPAYEGTSRVGQMEPWGPFPPASQPVTAAEAIGDDKPAYAADTVADLGCAAGRTGAPRPFAPESAEAGADSFAFLRMFGEDGNPVGEADELFRGPVLTGLGYAGEERLAEVSLGMCEGGGYAVAGNSAYLRASAAAMLAGADALDREAEFDAAWEQDAAAEPDSEDETVPEPAAEVLADTGTEQTEMADGEMVAAVSGEGDEK
jgi:hypothetical protein